MSKERLLNQFRDIVEPRRKSNDAVAFMTRHWAPQAAYKVNKVSSPTQLKDITAKSKMLDHILDELSPVLKKSKAELKKEVVAMLEEIGLDRKMYIIRWLGVFTTKVLCRMYSSVFVNERNMFRLKSSMGHNPVVFVPTHRSYADFILMTYISFFYDIEFPAVAAGMDFHAMVGLGRVMRDTCAFYMRRTFATDKLYGAVFRQYVRTLVVNHHAPLEFFIEGTRSRSGKSMAPKYGFMSMVLEPLFSNDISDVTFVPINISYDKVLEEKLFAYELLGVPKPKESTSGFLRAMKILNEYFGNIYINIGEAFSAKDYLRSYSSNGLSGNIKPSEVQNLTPEHNRLIQILSHEIIYRQQQKAIVTTFQMVSVALTISLHRSKPFIEIELCEYVIWLSNVFKALGGNVFDYDADSVKTEFNAVFATHSNLVKLDKEKKLRLINTAPFLLTNEIKKKMKGHQLSSHTMDMVIPVVMIQLYVNPVLHWLISASAIHLIVAKSPVRKAELWEKFKRIRTLLKHEFPVNEPSLSEEFQKNLQFMIHCDAVRVSNGSGEEIFTVGDNEQIHELLINLLWPFLTCLYTISVELSKETSIEEKSALKLVQKGLESQLTDKANTHPYCLSLDCILNCIQGLVADKGLLKERKVNSVIYNVNPEKISEECRWLGELMPNICVKFDHSNPVMVEQLSLVAKL